MNPRVLSNRLILVIILSLTTCQVFSLSEALAEEENPLGLRVDVAGFLNPSDTTKTYLEVYYSLRRHLLYFRETEGIYTAEMQASLFLFTEIGDTVDQTGWTNVTQVDNLEELGDRGYLIIDQLGAVVEPGEYVLEVRVEDRLSESWSTLRKEIVVPQIRGRSLSLSDIELGYLIEPDTNRGVFYKNGYRVMPAPPGEFDPIRNLIYFYAEVYGLKLEMGSDPTPPLMEDSESLFSPEVTVEGNIAVVDLEGRGISKEDALLLSDRLRAEIWKTQQFSVLERQQMNRILQEQGFQLTGACDEQACLLEIGKLLPVEKIVGGSAGRIGSTWTVTLRLVDLETGKIDRTTVKDCRGCVIDDVLSPLLAEAANDLAGVVSQPTLKIAEEGTMLPVEGETTEIKEERPSGSTYAVAYSVLSEEGKPYKDFSSGTYGKPGGTAVIMSAINPAGLPSGDYLLRLEVIDNATGEAVTGQKRFSVTESIDRLAARGVVWDLAERHPEAISIDNEKEAKLVRNQILYLSTKRELKTYDQLNLTGKTNFMKTFWEAKDPDPSTALNEFKIQHYARWDYANERFSRFKGLAEEPDGWKTDKGRVYIIYGPPDEVERFPSDLGTKPWEKWNYFGLQGQSQEGMAYFIFLDEDGFGSYRLIHSSVKGEIQTYNWQSRVRMGNIMR